MNQIFRNNLQKKKVVLGSLLAPKLKSTETNEYIERRASINKEINSHQVKIDRTCFKKTLEEKVFLSNEKRLYKQNLVEEYQSGKITYKEYLKKK